MRIALLTVAFVLGQRPAGGADVGELQVWRRGAEFDVTSQLHASEAGGEAGGPAARDVATRLRASLRVVPVWRGAGETLLQFSLLAAWAEVRGAAAGAEWARRRGPWDARAGAAWAARWDAGRLTSFYADPTQDTDFLNYQRALTSLFQFQVDNGEYNETDISGTCNVLYESVSADIIRKIKRACVWEERSEEAEEALQCRRVTRVELQRGETQQVFTDEVCALGPLKARGWVKAVRTRAAAPPPPAADVAAADVAAAAAAAAAALGLRELPLPLQRPRPDPDLHPTPNLAEAIQQYGEQLRDEEAGAGGTVEAAEAALAVWGAMQGAGAAELRGALHEPGAPAALWALAGAAGGAAAVHLREQPPHPHATAYLRGLSLALRPREPALRLALDAAERAPAAAVRAAAARAAAAAAARAPPALQRDVAAALLRRLARCADDACRLPLLRALGSLDAADALLAAAEAGGERAAAAALRALEAAPPAALPPRALRRLERLALTASRPLAVRGAALLLAAERALRWSPPLYEVPARLATQLSKQESEHELRRLLWGCVAALPLPAAARFLTLLPPNIRCWHTLANAGTSSVLERDTGWSVEGWNVSLKSVQIASGGVLRRGGVTLQAEGAAGGRELLAVHVWTRGLQAWGGGGGGEGGDEEEEAGAGLALWVGGAAVDDVTLFSSQAELLSLLWAGAGSSDTAVLRAFLPLRERGVSAALGTGALLRGGQRAGAALALDAAASVSLWGRTAAARLQLRGAAAADSWLAAAGGGGAARAQAREAAQGALHIAADLDFYSAVALCVRAELATRAAARNVSLGAAAGAAGAAGAPPRWLRRARGASLVSPGRSLALGRDNDVTCRTLGTADL